MEKTDNRNVLDELKQYSSSPALEAEFLTGRAGAAKSRSYLFNNMKTPFLILIISCAVFVAPLFTYAVILDKNVYVGDEPIILQACTQSGNELDGVIIYDLTNGDVLGSIACGFSIGFDLRQINWNLLFPVFHEYSIIEITKNDACEDPDILTYEQCKAAPEFVSEFRFGVKDPSAPDVTPPVIGTITATPDVVFSLRREMVPVEINVSVFDAEDPAPLCTIASVSNSDDIYDVGYDNTTPDWNITGNLTLSVRAERSGMGNGRVYAITVMCTDASGNGSTKTVTVSVPHDYGKNGGVPGRINQTPVSLSSSAYEFSFPLCFMEPFMLLTAHNEARPRGRCCRQAFPFLSADIQQTRSALE